MTGPRQPRINWIFTQCHEYCEIVEGGTKLIKPRENSGDYHCGLGPALNRGRHQWRIHFFNERNSKIGVTTGDLNLARNPDDGTAEWCSILWSGGTFKLRRRDSGCVLNREISVRYGSDVTVGIALPPLSTI